MGSLRVMGLALLVGFYDMNEVDFSRVGMYVSTYLMNIRDYNGIS